MRYRLRALRLGFILCFTGLTWNYTAYSNHIPRAIQSIPEAVGFNPQRGRILTREGQVLAIGRPGERHYPAHIAAPLLGFTGKDKGLEGLEAAFDTWLNQGNDLSLTLDVKLQAACEFILETTRQQFQAQYGSIVVMETGTGRLLAVVSSPGFDAQLWQKASPMSWRNRAFLDQYEPGSVIKPLVIAAMLSQGRTQPTRAYPTPMTLNIENFVLHDFNPHGPQLDLQGIIRYSSNTGMTRLMQDFPPERLRQALQDYGFGTAPSTLKRMTVAGHLKPSAQWGRIGHANHAFGQGFSATTVQIAAAFNALANDGLYVSPTLIEKGGLNPESERRRILTIQASQEVRRMMGQAVREIPHNKALLDGYPVAGKTGTAQLAENGRYSADKFVSVYAGFAPVEQPKITVVTMLYAARHGHHGAESSAPMFRQVVGAYVSQRGLPPNAEEQRETP